MQFPNTRLLIFAKEPVAGKVKTRLMPLLGKQGACAFHTDCLHHTVSLHAGERLAPISLWVMSDKSPVICQGLADQYSLSLHEQQGSDLGERMAFATEEALRSADSVLLLGTDAPVMGTEAVADALNKLHDGNDVVMIPAEDGGYVLLGMKVFYPELFTAMPWGTEKVATITRQRCQQINIKLVECPELWDVDRPEDFLRLTEIDSTLSVIDWSQHLPKL